MVVCLDQRQYAMSKVPLEEFAIVGQKWKKCKNLDFKIGSVQNYKPIFSSLQKLVILICFVLDKGIFFRQSKDKRITFG